MTRTKNLSEYLRSIHHDFSAVGITYCVVGGLAVEAHGIMRETEDIDILVSKDCKFKIRELIGLGYTARPGSSINLYYLTGGPRIPIDILVEGTDGMPDPAKHRVQMFGVWFVDRETLITLKKSAGRPQDLADVERLLEMTRRI